MTLGELTDLLREHAESRAPLAAVHERLDAVLVADPLDIAASDPSRWEMAPDDERLFWRLVYLFDTETEEADRVRELAARIVACLDRTGSATTHELLPLLVDQPRFCEIVARHRAGIVSRTGFLSVVAESGYPDHIKLWLQHASIDALVRLCARLDEGHYETVAAGFIVPPR